MTQEKPAYQVEIERLVDEVTEEDVQAAYKWAESELADWVEDGAEDTEEVTEEANQSDPVEE